ncbi:transmembrane protein, putative (macronuclear) [Tetrahymena thermophila SB210]|uniref:Transmembrane protein, putative n=1 Tax=Tetrahymena thermophila (strain SB210) TaxID=312017 RepID=W7XDY4_TETTS|nr:transmembrane protein, putative [Tetrahymena thermophila SB210]EWS71059.1 transmembrane protein, putative [Tetrahymena thermophila SB210]|eukprot:XP_012656400.1 transmembrane protein, putative [Tetrahymena thermophila SB210]
MEKNIIKGLIFTLVKLNTGIQFYFFYQYINQDQKSYIYSFVSFYVIERIFSWTIEISALNTKKLESLLILILNLVQLEEFYFMINYNRHSKYLEQGIIGQGVIICLFNIPLYIMSLVWVLKIQYTLLNVAFISIVLVLLYVGPFSVAFIMFIDAQQFNIDNFSKIKLWVFQYLYSYFQFFTFFWSLCYIWNYYNFQYYVLVVYCVLIVLQINYLWLRFKNNFQACDKYIFFILIIIKQLLHIVLRYSKKRNQVINILNKTGYKMYNSMIIFESLIKLYLLIAFWIVFKTKTNNQQLYSFQVTVLVMLIISFLILLYQSIINVLIRQYIYKEFIELDSIQEFIQLDKNSKEIKNKSIKHIQIFDNFYNQETHGINIIKDILFEYEGIEITGKDFNKKKIQNDKYYYIVQAQFLVKTQQILDAIQTKKVVSQIQSVHLNFQNDEQLYDLYKFWINHYIEISLHTNFDNKYYKLVTEIKQQMQSTISQLVTYQKLIFPKMIVNPYYIYYDLYD